MTRTYPRIRYSLVISTWFGLLVGFVAASAVCAQTNKAGPEGFNGARQASAECRADELVQSPAIPMTPTATSPDLSCAATPAEIEALRSQAGTVLIDIRTKSEFDENRIDGALNLPLAQLRGKAFLKGKSVVLIGNGKGERELYSACADLRKTNHKQVRVLSGGMPGWRSSGQAVTARTSSDTRPPMLSPYELWMETLFDANLVVVAKSRSDIRRLLPLAITIADETPATFKAALDRGRKESHDAPLAAMVLVTAPNTRPETLAALRDAIRPTPLLVYSDTNQAFAQQMDRQHALWATQARGPRQVRCRS